MSQSDLARACFGETTDAGGRTVANGRDRINKYCAGSMLPGPDALTVLAKALGVGESDLSPEISAAQENADHPEVMIRRLPNGEAWTAGNVVVPLKVAVAMLALYSSGPSRPPTTQERRKWGDPPGY
jgi:transcriptional regulator with XRE-family HTH domain